VKQHSSAAVVVVKFFECIKWPKAFMAISWLLRFIRSNKLTVSVIKPFGHRRFTVLYPGIYIE
jgi:hypothetical protein